MPRNHRPAAQALLVLAIAAGCTSHVPTDSRAFNAAPPDAVLALVLDRSGSYAQTLDQRGYPAVGSLLQQLRRDRAGENDYVLIGQISRTAAAPVFEGTPRAFAKRFPTPDSFKRHVAAHSDPSGSIVFDNIAQCIEYSLAKLDSPGPKVLCVLSDMDDNLSAPNAEARLVAALTEWGQKGGSVGFYWVAVPNVERWRAHLKKAGVKSFVVESAISSDPQLPDLGS